MEDAISTSHEELSRAVNRLQLISSHDALVLLKNCLGGPKLQHVMRTSPCCDHPKLSEFDDLLRTAVNKNCNVSQSNDQWTQASLPVRSGGLEVRSVSKLASSAFLASAASTLSLQTLILQKCQADVVDNSASLLNWQSLSASEELIHPSALARELGTKKSQTRHSSHCSTQTVINITEQDCWLQQLLIVEIGSQQYQYLHADFA